MANIALNSPEYGQVSVQKKARPVAATAALKSVLVLSTFFSTERFLEADGKVEKRRKVLIKDLNITNNF